MTTRCCSRYTNTDFRSDPDGDFRLLAWRVSHPGPQSVARANVYEAILERQGRGDAGNLDGEMIAILAEKSAIVFDARPEGEYAIAHIPGSINLDARQLGRFTQNYTDRKTAIVVYSDGPFCDLSRSGAEDLVRLGYSNVRRYQLGLPVWRILGNAAETSLEGFRAVFRAGNSVIVDARSRAEYAAGTVPTAQSILAGEADKAKQDHRLRYLDPNTRIVVFADSAREAQRRGRRACAQRVPEQQLLRRKLSGLEAGKIFPGTHALSQLFRRPQPLT